MKLVIIEWLDSAQPIPSWEFLADLPEPRAHHCRTIGHLIKDGDEAKIVALSVARGANSDDWNQAAGIMTIPTCAIVRMEIISS